MIELSGKYPPLHPIWFQVERIQVELACFTNSERWYDEVTQINALQGSFHFDTFESAAVDSS